MEQEVELGRRMGLVGPPEGGSYSKPLRMKLHSGVKEFDTVLRKTHKIGRIFSLGRGRRIGSFSESILQRRNLIIPCKPITTEWINKLSEIHHLSPTLSQETRLFYLILRKIIRCNSCHEKHRNLAMEEKLFSECIVLDLKQKRAYFAKNQASLEKMSSLLASRVLYYNGKIPSSVKKSKSSERDYYMRDKIDCFSQEVYSIYHTAT